MYTKGGGKAGHHVSQLTTTNIASMSWIGLQVFQHFNGRRFHTIPIATSQFLTYQFAFLPSLAFLCRLATPPTSIIGQTGYELLDQDFSIFKLLTELKTLKILIKVMVLSWKRGSKGPSEDE
ncbi:hypothetical protein BDN71DRAFT_1458859 [Pleurotus eryngii]|uniref:Uncharacterized protein n=1 Tax=Pleurotus eryngii TaxID=5323 RepID=A0A9P5ZHA7_PLEER|nr:hypothetical protein BDN71DRAFT_1458859 [Pleurotus eryngii]